LYGFPALVTLSPRLDDHVIALDETMRGGPRSLDKPRPQRRQQIAQHRRFAVERA
jgi:hypothetical protein